MNYDKSVVCPILIGRERDLQRLKPLLAQAQGGNGQIALISGEAGIGKSRLVREAKARARPETMILEGYCFQTDISLPYAPLLDLFRNLIRSQPDERLARALENSAPRLSKLFPELVVPASKTASGGTWNPDPEQEKRGIFQALVQTLTNLSQEQPLIVVIEDLHWSDATSLEFLLLLARQLASQAILLLLTYRSDETTPELTHFLAELDRQRLGTEFLLKPMSLTDVDAMLRAILDSPEASIRQEFLEAIVPLTEGNPFFIEEILRALMAEGDIFYSDGAWGQKELSQLRIPRTIKDAVQRRSQQLAPGTLQAFTLASVMGRRFDFRLLQELLQVDEAQLMAILKELIAAQLVVEESADHFAFRHALTREAIYTSLLLRERQSLHRSVADAIERVYAESLLRHIGDLSYHYFSGGAWQKASVYSRQAGDRAMALYAHREAVVYYSRAIVCARQMDQVVEPQLLAARGHAYELLSDFSSAQDDFEGACKAAREQGDGQAEWRALIGLGLLWAGRDYQQTGQAFGQAEALARQLNEARLVAHSLNYMGHWYFVTGRTSEALECHRQALASFEGEQDEEGMARTRDMLGMARLHHGDQVGSYQEYREAIRLLRKLDDRTTLVSALIGASHSVYDETDHISPLSRAESEGMTREALMLARQVEWPFGEAFAEWGLTLGLGHWGMFQEALTHARVMARIAAEIEHPQRIIGAHYALGYLYVLMLQPDLAIPELEEAWRLGQMHGSAWLIGNTATELALAYLLKRDSDRARALLESVPLNETGHHTRSERRMLWAKGYLLLAEKNPVEALRIAEHLLDSKKSAEFTQPIPALLKLQGDALFALKKFRKAEQSLEAAKLGAEQREALPLLWQIHARLGWLHKEQKNTDRSEQEFASARRVLEILAAQIQDPELREGFLHAAQEMLPKERKLTPRQSQAEKFGGLTAREREIARYLSQGKSNREIAEGLVLSERTVESHVGNILTKLGFDSRAQVAVWAVERGLGKE